MDVDQMSTYDVACRFAVFRLATVAHLPAFCRPVGNDGVRSRRQASA